MCTYVFLGSHKYFCSILKRLKPLGGGLTLEIDLRAFKSPAFPALQETRRCATVCATVLESVGFSIVPAAAADHIDRRICMRALCLNDVRWKCNLEALFFFFVCLLYMSQGWGEGCTANLLSLESTLLAGGWARSWSQFTVHSSQLRILGKRSASARFYLLLLVSSLLLCRSCC